MNNCDWIIGIDEVGRGPLAGPVGVGIVIVPCDFDWSLIDGVRDSKKVTAKNRETIFQQAESLKQADQLNYAVSLVDSSTIDKIGIVPAIKQAMNNALKEITARLIDVDFNRVIVKLDGGLKAPAEYINKETIIKGDDKELVIGLASIVAKVTRDDYMYKLSKKSEFSVYGFEKHKGYGTKLHRQAIIDNGLSRQHRVSFCQNIIKTSKGL